mgnify:CR=1 FL=1
MTTRAEEIAAKEYPITGTMSVTRQGDNVMRRTAFVNGYKQGQQDRWISAKDRLPKEGERVLATDGDTVGEVLYVHYGANTRTALAFRRTTTGPVLDDVTHWQLLPTPPNPEQR